MGQPGHQEGLEEAAATVETLTCVGTQRAGYRSPEPRGLVAEAQVSCTWDRQIGLRCLRLRPTRAEFEPKSADPASSEPAMFALFWMPACHSKWQDRGFRTAENTSTSAFLDWVRYGRDLITNFLPQPL